MTEVLHDQNEQRDPRPIGRFLLGMEGFEGQYDPIEFASSFARSGDRFQNHKHKSAKVDGEEVWIDGRRVEVEFKIDRYAYIWRIIVFAEKHLTEHLGANYHPHGGEIYELHCAVPKSSGTYAEYGAHRNIIRQREFNDESQLAILQGVVERVVRLSTGY